MDLTQHSIKTKTLDSGHAFLKSSARHEQSKADLDKCRHEIEVKYLRDLYTQDQLLRWLKEERGIDVTKRQLTHRLKLWELAKIRSHQRPATSCETLLQGMLDEELERHTTPTSLVSPVEQLPDIDEDIECWLAAEASFPKEPASCGQMLPPNFLVEEQDYNFVIKHNATLAESLTSSQMTGLHSLKSCKKRIQLRNHEDTKSCVSLDSMALDKHQFNDLKMWYGAEPDRSYLAVGGQDYSAFWCMGLGVEADLCGFDDWISSKNTSWNTLHAESRENHQPDF